MAAGPRGLQKGSRDHDRRGAGRKVPDRRAVNKPAPEFCAEYQKLIDRFNEQKSECKGYQISDNRYEIRLSGSGAGLILAGVMLAEAASIYDRKEAVQTQSYGPESRGGASKSEVVISDEEIDYPKVTNPNDCFWGNDFRRACDKYAGALKPGGVAILDSFYVEHPPEGTKSIRLLPLTAIAKDVAGKAIVANMVALGAIVALSGVVSREAIEKAVLDRVPKGTEEMNLNALRTGFASIEAPQEP